MSHISGKDKKLDIGDIYRESLKASEEYEACLTTTIYGNTYLDPEKCKARGFDPIKALEEEEERTDLSGEWIERTADEKGFNAMFQEFIDKAPPEYVNKDLEFSVCFDDFPKKKNKENKSYKKLPIEKNRSLLDKASYLLNRKIKLEDGFHVKVVGVKMSNDGIFLEVEEKVEDKLEYYEIMYQQDMVEV
ncbi:hypothetical protein RhiirA5_435364 [Rhizophagus irregularis]|uniref:Uncharacterized protein n=1 Tax=Rhizophagus irregularis TaxID=588596 RepID=A0A2N0NNJ1_9GLOM|nr:hypothetical protein RhiirA5_435364 [Rhizophagus irregularis]PKC55273.1 hypothetical protein RhiirA1_504018 [Rhizophagus irregularis]CAB4474629.1 unnamed protein product [Rhizophagus irregularis]CAB5208322.1 unnamed protein product [Rhizophagus irregularis]CAB5386293.1 unnamed protein product [Rhizophagus irregularis]